MGIVERKEREREEMRQLILDGAQKLFLANGFEKVSIRNIADEIEYSPATIYLYFKDKNELLFALHQRGFVKMIGEFLPLQLLTDPFEKLVEMGRSYIRFAVENPELFDLMFIMNAPMDTLDKKDWVEGDQAFGLLMSVVQECMDAGIFQKHDVQSTAMMIWSSIHGYTALFLRKRLGMIPECDRQSVMDEAFNLFCETLKRGL
ncbi:TetR/AcrR family transcriptional regulator [Spirosoma sp. KCTC 42546]|uniref:TetR/AcrR family transcriptional regulator n=1 Tax=Spirosoma sp. KCTC 42546 TaxID=2520506 RepID=UPI00115A55FB|nr:TetR/AcrR family transcriptional regulator [Spirosoma sp. KCTC 42546]QDK82858.1 TetR/AcrR family transcriptional regulator [Spirosoma sp. KCTC 42546]